MLEELLLFTSKRKLERDLNRSLQAFGTETSVTISDATRFLRDNPELLKMIDDFIDKLEAK